MTLTSLVIVAALCCCSISEIESAPAPPLGNREINQHATTDRKPFDAGILLQELCRDSSDLEFHPILRSGLCKKESFNGHGSSERNGYSSANPPPPQQHIIFVEVPVKTRVRTPVPTTVYVLPPEETHLYRIFDMRSGGKPIVSYLNT